jgi:hypothetical protein
MQILIIMVAIWVGLNLAVFAFILWQRSPHFRHHVSKAILSVFAPKQTSSGSLRLSNLKRIEDGPLLPTTTPVSILNLGRHSLPSTESPGARSHFKSAVVRFRRISARPFDSA